MSKTWLTRAWKHLEEGDTYSALEEFNGAIFRHMRTKDFVDAKKILLEASQALIERKMPHEVRLLALRYKKQLKRTNHFKEGLYHLLEVGKLLLGAGFYNEGENIFRAITTDGKDDSKLIHACANILNDEKLAKASGMPFDTKVLAATNYIQINDYRKAKEIFMDLLEQSVEQKLQFRLLTYISLVNLLDNSIEQTNSFLQRYNEFNEVSKTENLSLPQLTMEVIHSFEVRDFNQFYQVKTRFESVISSDRTLKLLFQEIIKLRPQSSPIDGLYSLFGKQ
ncbi:MAG: hypothetical protein ACFFCQ_11760 [Promethearchaeota archaeon]